MPRVVAWKWPKGVVKTIHTCATYAEAERVAAGAHAHYFRTLDPETGKWYIRPPRDGEPRFLPRST